MTDAEIIKALERCGNLVDSRCKECPYHMAYNASCVVSVMRDTLDLIDRKTEEICVLYDTLEAEQHKVCELEKEIERLKSEIRNTDNALYALDRPLVEIKHEAYREFAEKFKHTAMAVRKSINDNCTYIVDDEFIDNTLDELTKE